MDYKHLLINISGQIMIVRINRPEALNAINSALMTDLNQLFTGLDQYPEVRGVILTGAGDRAFVAGADIKEFILTQEDGEERSSFGHRTFDAIESAHVPVIAAINGFALGGGCELAMACHMRIAGEKAKFGQPEVNLGLIPGYGGTQRLPRLVGKGTAMEILLSGKMIDASEAKRIGLVNEVVPAGTEVEAAEKMLRAIIEKAPGALSHILELVNLHYVDQAAGFQKERNLFGVSMASEDAAEGIQAFVEKRKPQFGRD